MTFQSGISFKDVYTRMYIKTSSSVQNNRIQTDIHRFVNYPEALTAKAQKEFINISILYDMQNSFVMYKLKKKWVQKMTELCLF